jgi:hypothetical protein
MCNNFRTQNIKMLANILSTGVIQQQMALRLKKKYVVVEPNPIISTEYYPKVFQ